MSSGLDVGGAVSKIDKSAKLKFTLSILYVFLANVLGELAGTRYRL